MCHEFPLPAGRAAAMFDLDQELGARYAWKTENSLRCVILPRALPRFEAELLGRELESARADGRVYRALALCCWLEHVRLRRDSWLVRSRSWRRTNVEQVLGWFATAH